MIKSFRIKGFKGVKDLELPGMTRLTLLGGHNNIGKTTVLEAIFMFYDRLNPGLIFRQFAARGIIETPLDPELMWAPIFYDLNMEHEISFSVTDHHDRKETMVIKFNPEYVETAIPIDPIIPGTGIPQIRTDKQPTLSYALDLRYTSADKEQASHLLFGPNGISLKVDYMRGTLVPVTIFDARAHINVLSGDVDRFSKLDVLNRIEPVTEVLKIIEPRLEGLSVVSIGKTSLVYGDIGIGRKMPIALMGDGICRLLSIVLALNTNTGGIVLVDEIESGFHYSVMPTIWRAIAEAARLFNVQVVATTHSYEALEAAVKGLAGDMEDEFSYIRLDKNRKNIHDISAKSAKTFRYHSLKTAIERQWEVR